jgi:hypothetical protein
MVGLDILEKELCLGPDLLQLLCKFLAVIAAIMGEPAPGCNVMP